jgi:hypothetical protein
MNTAESIESINSRSRQALTQQITNHVQAQLNNAFTKNQITPAQDPININYLISYPTNTQAPIVITQGSYPI